MVENERGIFITWKMFKDKKTSVSEKFLLIEIGNLSMLEHGCIASNSHFAETMGIKKEAVSRLISSLEKKGYISTKIKNGSRNFSRTMTINKLLFDPKQIVISPLTNCLETKGNKTTNKTLSEYEDFLEQLEKACRYKSKVTKTKEGEKLFKQIEDKQSLFSDYINHQLDKDNFAIRITDFMKDYKTVHSKTAKKEEPMSDADFWGAQ